jgi:hypothetical protein
MTNFLRKTWNNAVDRIEKFSPTQYAKLWVSAISLVLMGLFGLFPALAVFVLQLAAAVAIFVSLASLVVTQVFGKVERLEPIDNLYTKLGEWLAAVYAEEENDDVQQRSGTCELVERSDGSDGAEQSQAIEQQPAG